MKRFAWYRKLLGGTWAKYSWFPFGKNKKKSEWRKVHNGKWVEWREL